MPRPATSPITRAGKSVAVEIEIEKIAGDLRCRLKDHGDVPTGDDGSRRGEKAALHALREAEIALGGISRLLQLGALRLDLGADGALARRGFRELGRSLGHLALKGGSKAFELRIDAHELSGEDDGRLDHEDEKGVSG